MELTRPCHLLKISIINLFQKKRALYYKEGKKEHKTLITTETLRSIMRKEDILRGFKKFKIYKGLCCKPTVT